MRTYSDTFHTDSMFGNMLNKMKRQGSKTNLLDSAASAEEDKSAIMQSAVAASKFHFSTYSFRIAFCSALQWISDVIFSMDAFFNCVIDFSTCSHVIILCFSVVICTRFLSVSIVVLST